MLTTVRGRADTVATLRWINVRLMETLASWVPTTPEMEVKILFGKHLWDFAQHADAFGHRAAELRLARHASREPVKSFSTLLDHLAQYGSADDRMDAFYNGILPVVDRFYARYLDETDQLLDEPTVRIVERARWDFERLRRDRDDLLEAIPTLGASELASKEVAARAAEVAHYVDFRPTERDAPA